MVLYGNIDQTFVNSWHGLLNFEIGGLVCRVITSEYKTRIHWIRMYHLFCNGLVHMFYSVVSGQCSYKITNVYCNLSFVLNVFVYVSCRLLTQRAESERGHG